MNYLPLKSLKNIISDLAKWYRFLYATFAVPRCLAFLKFFIGVEVYIITCHMDPFVVYIYSKEIFGTLQQFYK